MAYNEEMPVAVERIVDLRIAAMRRERQLGDERAARIILRADLRPALAAADAIVELLPGAGRAPAGAFIIRPNPGSLGKTRRCEILLPSRRAAARRWACAMLDRHAAALRGGVVLHLLRGDADLLPELERRGLYLTSVHLGGEPRRALRRLRRAYGALEWGSVVCRPLETRRQITAVVRIMRDEFTRNPQFGDFVAGRGFLRDMAALMQRELDGGLATQWVLLDGREVAGHFGFVYSQRSLFGRSIGRVGLTFRHDVQGRGLSKPAYRTMLERMLELEVGMFAGGTSQPPILKLGKVMGRQLLGYEIRPGRRFFDREHFAY